MSENTNFNVQINYSEKSLSVTGSEEFIQATLDKFVPDIKAANVSSSNGQDQESINQNNDTQQEDHHSDKYELAGIYSYDSETDQYAISESVPGHTKSQKMLNIGLLLGLLEGRPVTQEEIKEQAVLQGAYDQKNMSTYFSRDVKNFIKRSKRGSSWSVELTIAGKNNAKDLLESIYTSTQGDK